MTYKQQICVGAAILNKNDTILMVKRSADDDFMPNSWELPGGGTEYGEEPEKGLKREILEECGIEIEVFKPLTTGTYYMKKADEETQRVEIVFSTMMSDPDQEIKLSEEHSEYQWFTFEQINKLQLSDFMRNILRGVENNI